MDTPDPAIVAERQLQYMGMLVEVDAHGQLVIRQYSPDAVDTPPVEVLSLPAQSVRTLFNLLRRQVVRQAIGTRLSDGTRTPGRNF